MRHNRTINHLSRKSAHRRAMLSNMAVSLILHKRITTTLAKAKALRTFVEPLITRTKNDCVNNRRIVFQNLQSKEAVNELFREISQKVADRPGGYTRILKTGNRLGDNAEMCIIELVDYNEIMLGTKEVKTKTSRRRRSTGTGKKTAASSPAKPRADKKETKKEKPKTETEEPVDVIDADDAVEEPDTEPIDENPELPAEDTEETEKKE